MGIAEGTLGLKTAEGEYDFAVDGGAVGTITMRSVNGAGAKIPNGAVIVGGYVDVLTAFTTAASGTAQVQAQTAADLVAAAVVSGAPWSTTGLKSVVPAFTGASSIKLTAERALTLVIAVGAITAGKCRAVVFYR